MVHFSRLRLAIFCVLLIMPALLAAEESVSSYSFSDNLIKHLGLLKHKALLQQGGAIHTGLLIDKDDKDLPEEISVVGAMLLVRDVSPEKVIKAFMHSEIFKEVYEVERNSAFSDIENNNYTFGRLSLDPEFKLARAFRNPGRRYNLSADEAQQLKSVVVTGNSIRAAEKVWHKIFEKRLDSFIDTGVNGIKPYVAAKNKQVSPATELNTAIKSSSFLNDQFPRFLSALPVPLQPSEFDQQYFWIETEFDDQNVWALSTELRMLQVDSAIAADLHFYATRGYYSMLTFIGVVPYGEHSLVFAINHTYTDAITGFLASIKQRMGRKHVAELLSRHLELVRLRFEK